MNVNARCFPVCVAMLAATVIANSQSGKSQTNPTARGDAVIDGLKFHPVGGFIQVVDVAKSVSAGTILFPPNQPPVFAAMPGYDAKMKAAYEKYAHGDTAEAAPPAKGAEGETTPAPAAPAAPAAPVFDAASKTVTWSDGRSVTFVDNDNLKVQMPGAAGGRTYALHFHKAGAGGFMRGVAGADRGRVGGSLGGGGVTISLAGPDGTAREVYDTAKGIVYANSGFEQAKSITAAVREATAVAKSNGQPELAKLPVVNSLLTNNLGL